MGHLYSTAPAINDCKNITLVGDAAHPMVPFLGQGACMAIEDAYSFAMLCKYKNGNFIDAQKIYDLIRSKRTKKIQKASLLQGKNLSYEKSYDGTCKKFNHEIHQYSWK